MYDCESVELICTHLLEVAGYNETGDKRACPATVVSKAVYIL